MSDSNSEVLKELFDKLKSPLCAYSANEIYSTFDPDGNLVKIPALEILTVSKNFPREDVMVASFYDSPSKIAYVGENSKSMKDTVDRLRLPSHSENLGEGIFCRFRGHLKRANPDLPTHFEQSFDSGCEKKLEFVLKKLICVYSGGDINQKFYQNH